MAMIGITQFHRGNRVEYRVMDARRGRTAILRIERRDQYAIATGRLHARQPVADARIAVAHRPVDHHAVQPSGQLFGLPARIKGQWRPILGPHQTIGVRRFCRPRVQNHPAQDRLPDDRGNLDHALVRQKLLEIAFDGLLVRRIGRAEVDQQQADFLRRDGRMIFWQWPRFTHGL